MAADPLVVIRILPSGELDVSACGTVRIIWIDQTSTAPEVFEQQDRVPPAVILRMLGAEMVGAAMAPKPGRPQNLRVMVDEPPPTHHANGAPLWAPDGTLLDQHGNRSIFDDVDQ